ncbi:MAG: hypothetical protein E7391_01975 [Ruminococcaceae bacterium]|nr:hypothetical protein [Oscillospiraceae bacterium]
MYETKDGKLMMIWSNIDNEGNYCVGIAHSNNGLVDGVWSQEEIPMFSKKTTNKYDGGHGMVFKDNDGKMYMSVHSPNHPT